MLGFKYRIGSWRQFYVKGEMCRNRTTPPSTWVDVDVDAATLLSRNAMRMRERERERREPDFDSASIDREIVLGTID